MKIDWNIRIEDTMASSGSYKIRHAVEGKYCIVFVECGSWKDEEKLRDDVLKELSE